MTISRLRQQEEEANQFLNTMGGEPPQEEPSGIQPQDTPAGEPPQEPSPSTPASSELDNSALEIARLRALLDDENSPTYKAKFASLEGRFQALVEQYRELKEELKVQKEVTPPSPPATPPYKEAYNQLVDDYGEVSAKNIMDLVQSLARIQAEEIVSESLKPYEQKITQVEQAQAKTKEERFFSALAVRVPDWKDINGWPPESKVQKPEFAQFLSQTVPATDYTYDDLLKFHSQSGNAAKAAEIFDIFKATVGKAPVAPESPSKKVEHYIDPSKTGQGGTPPDIKNKTYSSREVEAFFSSLTKGTFQGTREEAQAMEREYTQAMIEGRVT